MSSSVTEPAADSNITPATGNNVTSPSSKGKTKAEPPADEPMNEEEDDDEEDDEEDEEDEDEGEDEDEVEEENLDDIDPSLIVSGRRTRGFRIDYSSKEALEKAGLATADDDDDDDDDGDVDMK